MPCTRCVRQIGLNAWRGIDDTDPMSADLTAVAASHRAAVALGALGNADRLTLLATAVRLQANDECTIDRLMAELGLDAKTLVRQAAVLQGAGLLGMHGRTVTATLEPLAEAADRLVEQTPGAQLLAKDPELARFFEYGRLRVLPIHQRVEERRQLAALLIKLIPADVTLNEAEINAILHTVMDDVALLRRFLVEEGQLTRGASQDYRRVS